MDKDYLKDEGDALIAQKHQLNKAQSKLSQINTTLDLLKEEQEKSKSQLDDLMANAELFLAGLDPTLLQTNEQEEKEAYAALQVELDTMQVESQSKIQTIDELDSVLYNDNMSWSDYINSFNAYAERNHIDLSRDPFEHLMSKAQQIELQKRIKEEFSYKNAQCDKYDYMIAGTCGVIGGLIDILFVGEPGDSKLGNWVDDKANSATEKFAEWCGWNRQKAENRGRNTTKSAIAFLEQKFKVNYDQATTSATGGLIPGMSMSNHHLKSLGHSPDIIGLFFSILNQFTNTSSFVSDGKIITIKNDKDFELQGSCIASKIFCGFVNWFGHLASDWTGSSGAAGRGSGIPIPFYNLFQLCDFGSLGKDKKTLAQISTEVFEKGYDLRHGLTMAIPVVITELLIRLLYVIKQRFYHDKDWCECIPSDNTPELRRMLVVGHGTLCLIDGVDAAIRSGNPLANGSISPPH